MPSPVLRVQLPGPHLSRPKDLAHHQEGADNPETYTWSENPPECVAGQCEQEWYFVPVSAEASTTYYKPSLCYLMVVSSLNTNAPLTDTESQVCMPQGRCFGRSRLRV